MADEVVVVAPAAPAAVVGPMQVMATAAATSGRASAMVRVVNLDENTDEAGLRTLLGAFGNVVSIVFRQTASEGRNALVVYEHAEDAALALAELAEFQFGGRMLSVVRVGSAPARSSNAVSHGAPTGGPDANAGSTASSLPPATRERPSASPPVLAADPLIPAADGSVSITIPVGGKRLSFGDPLTATANPFHPHSAYPAAPPRPTATDHPFLYADHGEVVSDPAGSHAADLASSFDSYAAYSNYLDATTPAGSAAGDDGVFDDDDGVSVRAGASSMAPVKKFGVWVGYFPEGRLIDRRAVMQMFSSVGQVHSVVVPKDPVTGRYRNYAYVNFLTMTEAEFAAERMRSFDFQGSLLRSELTEARLATKTTSTGPATLFSPPLRPHSKIVLGPGITPTTRNVFSNNEATVVVEGIAESVSETDIYDAFATVGQLFSVNLIRKGDGAVRDIAFVNYRQIDAAITAATVMNQIVLGGRPISARLARPRVTTAVNGLGMNGTFTNIVAGGLPGQLPLFANPLSAPGYAAPALRPLASAPYQMPNIPSATTTLMPSVAHINPAAAPFVSRNFGGAPAASTLAAPPAAPLGLAPDLSSVHYGFGYQPVPAPTGTSVLGSSPAYVPSLMGATVPTTAATAPPAAVSATPGPTVSTGHGVPAPPALAAAIASADVVNTQNLGARLLAIVTQYEPQNAAKITGMLLTLPHEQLIAAFKTPRVLHQLIVDCQQRLLAQTAAGRLETDTMSTMQYRGYSVDQVAALMGRLNLPSQPFVDNNVDGLQLVDLDMDAFTKDLGLKPLQAKRLMRHLHDPMEVPSPVAFNSPATPAPTPTAPVVAALPPTPAAASINALAVRPVGPLMLEPATDVIAASTSTPPPASSSAVISPPNGVREMTRQSILRRVSERTTSSAKAFSITTTLMALDASELEQLLASPDELVIVIDNLLAVADAL